jgi:hypothetical protein
VTTPGTGGVSMTATTIQPALLEGAACQKKLVLGSPLVYTCALPKRCESVTYDDGTLHAYDQPQTEAPSINLDAARCVLRSLRDDVVSALEVNRPNLMGSTNYKYWVLGDQSVVVEIWSSYDSPSYHYAPTRFLHRDRTWFDTCIQLTDPPRVFECLTSWWTQCYAEDQVTCSTQ